MATKSATTSKAKKSKSGTVNSSLDQISVALVSDFEKIVGGSLPAEFKVFAKACGLLSEGQISVRGLKASIEKANEIGALPTIKPSHAQEFVIARRIQALAGGENATLKVLLNTAHQAKKHFNGKDGKVNIAEALDFVQTFADLVDSIPSQGEKAKRKARTAGDKVEKAPSVEALIKALGSELKKKPVLKGQALKDAEAVAFLLAQALERSRVTLKVA
jgi:hypothetical protein